MFRPPPLYLADGYKVGHPNMISPEAVNESWHGIPRSLKHAHPSITHITCFGHEYAWRFIIDVH